MSDTPERIGRYVVEDVLGRGAMGVVYRAHDPEIERTVAIKLVLTNLLEGQERAEYVARFRREAQAAGRCMHPNIVAMFDFALHDGNPFLVMEYVAGSSLSRSIGQRLPPARALALTRQVLEALECAHAVGVVHRDIKPANLLLMPGDRVKVTDFGISRLEQVSLTQSGMVVGTPSYMSPEQCRGAPVDGRSDLFSVGALLFELLTGSKPFQGSNFTEIVAHLLHDESPDIRQRWPEAPDALAAVIRRALTRDPTHRFPDARAMITALDACLGGGPSPDQATTVQAGHLAVAASPSLPDEIASGLQRLLTQHVGPIARTLLSSTIARAPDLDQLCDSLARHIPSETERSAFRLAARAVCRLSGSTVGVLDAGSHRSAINAGINASVGGSSAEGSKASRPWIGDTGRSAGPSARPAPPIDAAMLTTAQAALAHHLGPIARILVKRAAGSATNATELWAALAVHISQPDERATFLATQPH